MPNGVASVNVEVAEPAIELTSAATFAAGQRVAWEVSTPLGFMATGLAVLGGSVGSFFTEGLGRAAMKGLAASGAAVGGWIITEQFLVPGGAASKLGGGDRARGRGGLRAGAETRDTLPAAHSSNGRVPTMTERAIAANY